MIIQLFFHFTMISSMVLPLGVGRGTIYDDLSFNKLNRTSAGWDFEYLKNHYLCKWLPGTAAASKSEFLVVGNLYERGVAVNSESMLNYLSINADSRAVRAFAARIITGMETKNGALYNPLWGKIIFSALDADKKGSIFIIIDNSKASGPKDLDFTEQAGKKLRINGMEQIISQLYVPAQNEFFVYPNEYYQKTKGNPKELALLYANIPLNIQNELARTIWKYENPSAKFMLQLGQALLPKPEAVDLALGAIQTSISLGLTFLESQTKIFFQNAIITNFIIDDLQVAFLTQPAKVAAEDKEPPRENIVFEYEENFPTFVFDRWNFGMPIIDSQMVNPFANKQQPAANYLYVTKKFISYPDCLITSPEIIHPRFCVCLDVGQGKVMYFQMAGEFVHENAFDLMIPEGLLPLTMPEVARWKLVHWSEGNFKPENPA